MKFIDTLKYYQTSLAGLTRTATEQEKKCCKSINGTIFNCARLFFTSLEIFGTKLKRKSFRHC